MARQKDNELGNTRRPDGIRPGGAISRRGFLGGVLTLGAGATLVPGAILSGLGQAARAAGPGRRDLHYVFCYFNGGWDILLSIDPRDPALFNNGTLSATRIQPAYELVTSASEPVIDVLRDGSMLLGPFMGELTRHADKLCVVRGINMDTLSHEVGRLRFLTGRPPSGLTPRGSSTDTWLAGILADHEAIPNLTIGVDSYNLGDLPNYATALSTPRLDDLLRVLRPSRAVLPPAVEDRIDALLERAASGRHARDSALVQLAEESRISAKAMVSRGLDGVFDLRANTPEAVSIRQRFGMSVNELNTGKARAAMAGLAITSGVSRVVSFRPNERALDTHFANWQDEHGPSLAAGHTNVANLIDHLIASEYPDGSGDSWFDHTVVVGMSEFSRTPTINASGGRDHWLVNACFLAGGNIAGGRVVGASSNLGMYPLPVDLQTGVPCATNPDMRIGCAEIPGISEVIRPEHIFQALYHDLGLTNDDADLRVPPLRAILRR